MNRIHLICLYSGIVILSVAVFVQAQRINHLDQLTNRVWNDVIDVRQYAIQIAHDRSRAP